jgi:hypothetical protein
MNLLKSSLIKQLGLIIPSITAAAYLSAFFYNYGYISAYNIPINFVDTPLYSLITALVVVLLYSSFIYLIIELIHKKYKGGLFLGFGFGCAQLTVTPLFIIFGRYSFFDRLVFIFLIISTIALLVPIIKLLFRRHKQVKKNYKKIYFSANENLFIRIFLIFVLVIASVIQCYQFGYLISKIRSNFLTLVVKNEKYVVISFYKDNAMTLLLDRKAKKIENKFILFNPLELSKENISLNLEHTGRLKLKNPYMD